MKPSVLALQAASATFILVAWIADAEAPWAKQLEQELRQAIQPCEVNLEGEFKRPGDTFKLGLDGVTATPMGLGNTPFSNTINVDGDVTKGGRGFMGQLLSKNSEAAMDFPLERGERVCIRAIDIDSKRGKLKTHVVTRTKKPFMVGGTQRATRFSAVLEFTLGNRLMAMSIDEAQGHLWKFVAPDSRASSGSDPETGGAPTISLGMDFDGVRGALGAPEKTVNLGAKVIWVYKDLRVTFQDGKVADVQ